MAPILLVDHFPGCAPLTPCLSCKVAEFLKTRLKDEDLKALTDIVRSVQTEASIEALNLPTRVFVCLRAVNIKTVGDILKKTEVEFLRIPNFGKISLKQLKETLERHGRKIGEEAR